MEEYKMDFLPVMVYALTLGTGLPSATTMVDEYERSLSMATPQTIIANFDVEAQWAEFAFIGGSWDSHSGTEYHRGFQPLQAEYSVYGGVTFELGDIVVTASFEHTCMHPQASFTTRAVAWGMYGGIEEFKVKFSSSEFVNR